MTNVFFSDKYYASCNKRYANGVKVAAGAIFSPDSSDLPMLPYTVCKKCHKMATSASAAVSNRSHRAKILCLAEDTCNSLTTTAND